MPKAPRGKRVVDAETGAFTVVNKAPNGEAEPFFDKTRSVWVAPWRKPDGKVGRPTGRTRALAIASRDRHIAKLAEDAKFASSLAGGFTAESTVAELTEWWLQNIARHRVRATTFATYRKQLRLVDEGLGSIPARELRPEQIAGFVSDLIDRGSASRARNIRTLLVQVMDQAVELGLAAENVAKRVKTPKVPKVKRRTVTPDETSRILVASDPRFAAAIAPALALITIAPTRSGSGIEAGPASVSMCATMRRSSARCPPATGTGVGLVNWRVRFGGR